MPNSGRHISISRCRWTRRTKGSKVPHTGSYTSSRRSRGTPRSWRAISNRETPRIVLASHAARATDGRRSWRCSEDTLAHEQKVTAMIHDLCKLAAAEQDFATANMLQWFVNEQVEEEDTARRHPRRLQSHRRREGGRLHARPETRRTLNAQSNVFTKPSAEPNAVRVMPRQRKRRTKFNDFSGTGTDPVSVRCFVFRGRQAGRRLHVPAKPHPRRKRKGAPPRRRHSP